jgi:two-component system chemotaxis response regulator CheB
MTQPSREKIRVLVVDDSAFVRQALSRMIGSAPDMEVVGTAADGVEGLEKARALSPDVVTLDVKMPKMDGLVALQRIMAECPVPVLLLSSLTSEGADVTLRGLELGAVDFVDKSTVQGPMNLLALADELQAKVRALAWARERPTPAVAPTQAREAPAVVPGRVEVVVIGASTGGPPALQQIIPALPADLDMAILVVQHMPVGFTRSLAERLDSLAAVRVKEAEPGDIPEVGQVLLAPGGFHMVLDSSGQVSLNQNQPVHGVRPSVDVTLASVVKQYGPASVSVILTGMGSDGTNGSALVHGAGGLVVAEDESTCVVYGMPRSVVEAGIAGQFGVKGCRQQLPIG